MLIVNLAGGLGNQMFQYAMGFSIAEASGESLFFSSTFSKYSYHPKTIDRIFNLRIDYCEEHHLKSIFGLIPSSPFARRCLGKVAVVAQRQLLKQCVFDLCSGYQSIGLAQPGYISYLHGYWQSEQYFKEHFSTLRNKFTFRESRTLNELDQSLLRSDVKVGVHIRRGDYVSDPKASAKMGIPSLCYYIEGINAFRKRFPSSKIFVFSDDINWARSMLQLKFNNIWFCDLDDSNASSDMQMLSECDHFVLSNSTFGWWAAYLSTNIHKIVVTPDKWFADGSSDADIVPMNWVDSRDRLLRAKAFR